MPVNFTLCEEWSPCLYLVDQPLSFTAMTLLVGSYDPWDLLWDELQCTMFVLLYYTVSSSSVWYTNTIPYHTMTMTIQCNTTIQTFVSCTLSAVTTESEAAAVASWVSVVLTTSTQLARAAASDSVVCNKASRWYLKASVYNYEK